MSLNERLAYLTKLLWNSDYGWGKEIIGDADCSGSVCWGLWLMGYRIRVAADYMYHSMTTAINRRYKIGSGTLVFWVKEDKAFHVAVVEHDMIVMDAGRRFTGVPAHIVHNTLRNSEMEFKQVDWDSVKAKSDSGKYAYGVDQELRPLLGLFSIPEDESEPQDGRASLVR